MDSRNNKKIEKSKEKIWDVLFFTTFILIIISSGLLGWFNSDQQSPLLTSFCSIFGCSMIFMAVMKPVDSYIRSNFLCSNHINQTH
jgi:hypothetical protein